MVLRISSEKNAVVLLDNPALHFKQSVFTAPQQTRSTFLAAARQLCEHFRDAALYAALHAVKTQVSTASVWS